MGCCPQGPKAVLLMIAFKEKILEGFPANQRAAAVFCIPCKALIGDASARAAKAVLQVRFAVSKHSRATCRAHSRCFQLAGEPELTAARSFLSAA